MNQPAWQPAFNQSAFDQSDVRVVLAEYIESGPGIKEGLEEVRSGLFHLLDGRYLYLAATADMASGDVSCDAFVAATFLGLIGEIHPLDLEGFSDNLVAWIHESEMPR